jgi:hypothetical protein
MITHVFGNQIFLDMTLSLGYSFPKIPLKCQEAPTWWHGVTCESLTAQLCKPQSSHLVYLLPVNAIRLTVVRLTCINKKCAILECVNFSLELLKDSQNRNGRLLLLCVMWESECSDCEGDVLWGVMPCSLVDIHQYYRGTFHSFIPLACAECDDSLPFSGASSIPLCYILFPATLLHQHFFHPPLLHFAIYFLVYLLVLLITNSYTILLWEFCFLPFSVRVQTNVIYIALLSLLWWVFLTIASVN